MARGNGSGQDLWVELQERVTSVQTEMAAFREQVVAGLTTLQANLTTLQANLTTLQGQVVSGTTRTEEHLKRASVLISRLADEALAVQDELREHRERLTALERKVG